MTAQEQIELQRDVYAALLEASDTFEGALGRDGLYLLGAIAKMDRGCRMGPIVVYSRRSAISRVLRAAFGPQHLVWEFARIDTGE